MIGYSLSCSGRELAANLMTNLTATFVGSILTVVFVDAVLEKRQEARWAGLRSRAAKRLFGLANSVITALRVALKVSPIVVTDGTEDWTQDLRVIRDRMIRVAREVLPEQLANIPEMNPEEWQQLSDGLLSSVEQADRLLGPFLRDFPPRISELVLDIQSAAKSLANQYEVWSRLLGVDEGKLPLRRDGSSYLPTQQATYQLAIGLGHRLLDLCAELLEALHDLPSDPS
jgi:hypothetical protein